MCKRRTIVGVSLCMKQCMDKRAIGSRCVSVCGWSMHLPSARSADNCGPMYGLRSPSNLCEDIVVPSPVELFVFGGSQDTDLDEQFAHMVLWYFLTCCIVCEQGALT